MSVRFGGEHPYTRYHREYYAGQTQCQRQQNSQAALKLMGELAPRIIQGCATEHELHVYRRACEINVHGY